MKIKTSELEGAALDWSVANIDPASADVADYSPSTDWSQGGPLIGDRITVLAASYAFGDWHAECCTNMYGRPFEEFGGRGPTLLIAAMRAIVAAELGDTVDVPEELLP